MAPIFDAGDDLADQGLARIHFRGAAGEVTGSQFLLQTRRSRVLFDCGFFQGGREQFARNARPFAFDPRALDALVLTHAHIDHVGLVPRLVREGFRGKIHATSGTCDLSRIMLLDSAAIQESNAERENRWRERAGRALVQPLYVKDDAEQALGLFTSEPYLEWVRVAEGVQVRFRRAGHILGAASIEARVADASSERRIVFSGDIGPKDDPLLLELDPPREGDLVLMESTYGDRDHRLKAETVLEFEGILAEAAASGGNVIIPVFAVGRAQEVIYHIGRLEEAGRMGVRHVILDSPMAIDVTELYRRHEDCCELDRSGLRAKPVLATQNITFARTWEQSMAVNFERGFIVLAASGMCEAGRVLHHLKHHLWKPETHVVMVGFQARGSLGRAIVDGTKSVRILGEEIAVRAKVHTLGGFSAHAGQSELLEWYGSFGTPRPTPVLIHGEDDRRVAFAAKLRERFGVEALLPRYESVLSVPNSGVRFELSG